MLILSSFRKNSASEVRGKYLILLVGYRLIDSCVFLHWPFHAAKVGWGGGEGGDGRLINIYMH